MKRILSLLLCGTLCAGLLCGCASVFDRGYYSVTPHQEQSASDEDASILRAENYTDLVSCVQHFVSMGQASGTVHVYKYPGDITADLKRACSEVRTEDPLGAYALNSVDYSCNRIVSYYECTFNFLYRRTPEQIAAITTAYGTATIRDLLQDKLSSFATSLAIRTSDYYADRASLYTLVQEAYYADPLTAQDYPRVTVAIYPDSGDVRIVEFNFTYSWPETTMVSRVNATMAAAGELVGRDTGATATVAWLLYSRLLENAVYREDGSSSVYGALCLGSANSEGLALGYALLCRQAGISCTLVKGTLGDTPHCWNQVTLDGETYFLDLTRSDPEESFLLPAEELLAAGYQWSGAPETAPADTAAEKE